MYICHIYIYVLHARGAASKAATTDHCRWPFARARVAARNDFTISCVYVL